MKNSLNAFTIIELIFFIVITGILASIALPRLSTTRDDAKVSNCAENITLLMRDISTYYTSQGTYSLNLKEMSNVEIYETFPITEIGDAGEYYYICDKTDSTDVNNSAITFKFSKVTDSSGNLRTNLNAVMTSITQGTVDGDLGYLLDKKNIATTGLGIDHPITGIRVKR